MSPNNPFRAPARLGVASALLLAAASPLFGAKVRLANDNLAARALGFPGIDYGAFRVVEVDDRTADALVAGGVGEKLADADSILLNSGALNTTQPAVKALRTAATGFTGRRLHLVQFAGPIKPEWVKALEEDGLRVVTYIPNNAYLVWGESSNITRFQTRAMDAGKSSVQWEAAWRDEWKLAPSVFADASQPAAEMFSVQLVEDKETNAATLAALRAAGAYFLREPWAAPGYLNFVVQLPAAKLSVLSSQPDVVSVHRHVEFRKQDEAQAMVLAGNLNGNVPNPGNYFNTLANWGFTQAQFDASGFAVDVSDDGVDNGTTTPNHFVLYRNGDKTQASRMVYRTTAGTSGTDAGQGFSGHGQLNTSIIGGYVPNTSVTVGGNTTTTTAFPHADAQGFRYGLGIAPFVKLGNSTIFDPNFTNPVYGTLQSNAYAAGARVSSNSWGANVNGAYNSDSQAYDNLVRDAQSGTAGNQGMVIVFSAGNRGAGAGTIGSPGTGKNIITVGAAEGVRSHNTAAGGADAAGTDGCAINDTGADSANDIIGFSSRGPCTDGRVKPDIMAGGTHITGMTYVTAASTLNGTANAAYRADGVCALTGSTGSAGNPANFFPQNEQWYSTSSGTSHSAPAISGAAALVFQQFINNPAYLANRTPAGANPPSPALVKAYLMNSTRYMTGSTAVGALPSNNQGMGHSNLGMAFDGVSRAIRDQHTGDRFTATGQLRTFTGTITDSTKPFRVTLAWTDKSGPTSGAAYVNNLDLTVTVGGQTYRGNVFAATGGLSTTGGTADARNNVESVFLPAGTTGDFSITVSAANIAGQADPTITGNNQDYALVAYNSGALSSVATPPILSAGTITFGTGAQLVPNGCNTLTIPLSNGGEIAATAVSATLATTTTGVTVTQATSGYPNLAPGAAANNASAFQVSTAATVPCGTLASFTLTVTYSGGGSPTVIPFTLPVGNNTSNYLFTTSTGASIPSGGVFVAGSADDDVLVSVVAPFALSVYNTSVAANSTLRASTNGTLQLVASGGATGITNAALPSTVFSTTTPTLMPYWDDLILTTTGGGIYTNTVGSAPNRQWVVEWRGRSYLQGSTSLVQTINFAIVFTEGVPGFQYRYAQIADTTGANGSSATVGVQAAGAAGSLFTQYSFNTANSITTGLVLTAAFPTCPGGSGPCSSGTAPVFTSAPPTGPAFHNVPFTHTFTASGSPAPTFALAAFSKSNLPAGLTLSPSGVLSGTPNSKGAVATFRLSIQASNGVGPDAVQTFDLQVRPQP